MFVVHSEAAKSSEGSPVPVHVLARPRSARVRGANAVLPQAHQGGAFIHAGTHSSALQVRNRQNISLYVC